MTVHKKPRYRLQLEPLEPRRVLAAPSITSLSVLSNSTDLKQHTTLQASVADTDNDTQQVAFFLDNGDGQFTGADLLVGTDERADAAADNGWRVTFPTSGDYRIMTLGDSITQGSNQQQSYRYPLWKNLIDANYDFDFIGSQSTNFGGDATWSDYQGQSFDPQHEGHWGIRADQVLGQLPGWLADSTPDMVLLHLGTNDLFANQSIDSTLDDLESIIGVLRQDNPNVVVLAAQLIPSNFASNSMITAFNSALPSRVQSWHTDASPVVLVDQNSKIDPAVHLYDGVHPNASGENLIANTWQAAIEAARPIPNPSDVFSEASRTYFAVATDRQDNSSPPRSTSTQSPVAPPVTGQQVIASSSEITRVGNLVGDHQATHTRDGRYERITEIVNGDTRTLQHEWQFELPANRAATIHLDALQSGSSEAFYFNYSTDGISWRNFATVSRTTPGSQTFELPTGSNDTLWVKAKDSTARDTDTDTLSIDYLAVHLETTSNDSGSNDSDTTPGASNPVEPNSSDTISLPVGNVTRIGTSTSASHLQFSDNVYQQITESADDVDHVWRYEIASGQAATFQFEGYSSTFSESFYLNYSTDGRNYRNMLTVQGPSEQKLAYRLPAGTSGTVYVAIKDSSSRQGNNDTLYVDQAYIEVASATGSDDAGLGDGGSDGGSDDHGTAYASSETTTFGTSNGNFTNTHASDNTRQELHEDANGRLFHIWTLNSISGTNVELHLEGFTDSSIDDFWVNYSTDGISYRNLLTLSSRSEQVIRRALPSSVDGSIYIKIVDSNRSDAFSDSVFIDELKMVVG